MTMFRVAAAGCVAGLVIASGVGAAAAAGSGITPGHARYPSGGTTVTGIGNDADQDNAQLAEKLPAHLAASWHAQPPLGPEAANDGAASIGVADGRTVVVDEQYQAAYLSAYVSTTGRLLWRRSLIFPEPAAVVGGTVYVTSQDANGFPLVQAVDTANGRTIWTAHPANGTTSDTMSVASGLVVSGQTVIDQKTGAIEFTLPLGRSSSTNGNSLVGDGRIFYNSGGGVQADSLSTGKVLWSTATNVRYGNLQPALHDGLLYLPGESGSSSLHSLALSPSTGRVVRVLPPSPTGIAFDGGVGIFDDVSDTAPDVLSAVELSSGHVYWSRSFGDQDGQPATLGTAPVIENGLVWATSAASTADPTTLTALSETTGAVASRSSLACGPQWGSDLAFAEHRLAVPSACGVLTFVAPHAG